MQQRLGLLGGTFDPPHVGHLIVAEWARVVLDLSEVRFVVAGAPWMKRETASARQRVDMTALALDGESAMAVDDREVGRSGPTYTVDTLRELRDEDPDRPLFFLAGTDALARLDRWQQPGECLDLATFVALRRPGHDLPDGGPLLTRVRVLDVPAVDISSTDLRDRFARGGPVRHQLPARVERFVREHGLYGAAMP